MVTYEEARTKAVQELAAAKADFEALFPDYDYSEDCALKNFIIGWLCQSLASAYMDADRTQSVCGKVYQGDASVWTNEDWFHGAVHTANGFCMISDVGAFATDTDDDKLSKLADRIKALADSEGVVLSDDPFEWLKEIQAKL